MVHQFKDIDNVTIIVSPSYQFDKLLEIKSLRLFCITLNNLMNNDFNFEYYVFWGFIEDEHVLIKETSNYAKDKKNVLFWIGDEEGCIPSDIVFQRFNWVFKVHLRNENSIQRINGVNVYRKGLYHFPLLTIDDVPELEVLPFNKRKHDVYFCGNLNKNRFPLFYSLKEKKTMKEVLVNFLLRYNIRGEYGYSDIGLREKHLTFQIKIHIYSFIAVSTKEPIIKLTQGSFKTHASFYLLAGSILRSVSGFTRRFAKDAL